MSDTSLPAIAWHNLSYQTSTLANFQIKSKSILSQLSGAFHYGTLNALMGPSGSGKTTLLNCLSGKTASSPSSCIYRNSGNSGTCCFIEQNVAESIIGQLTVRQLFNYAFRFKNGPTPSEAVLKQHTRQVLEQLMLPEVLLDRKFSACSGGEQKRIAIGQELMCLNKTELLLIDEPTTGLDSTAALEVIHCLKQLTDKSGLCIVASIHQPNVSQLKLFNCLYVLAKGGVAVYSGPPGAIKDQLVLAKLVPNSAETPPIEVLLKATCDGLTSPAIAQLSISTQTTQNTFLQPLLPNMITSPTLHQTPFTFFSLQTHLCRQFRLTFLANCQTQLFFALLYILNYTMVATIFRSTSSEAGCIPRSMNGSSSCSVGFQEEIEFKENAFNLCYTVLYVGLVMIYSSTVDFTENVQSLQSEHRNNWYSLPVFYLSTLFTSFINLTLTSLLISSLAYFFTSQHAADEYSFSLTRYAHFTLFIWILCLYVQGIGHLVGVLLQAYEASFAAMASNILYLCLSMVNGFFVNTDISGNWLIINGTNLVALKFISRGLVYSIYGFDRCETGEESIVLQFLNVNTETVWSDCWWILGNMAFLRLTTFLVLYCKFELTWGQPKQHLKAVEGIENPVIIETSSVDPNPATEPNFEPENDSLSLSNSIILAWRHLHLYTSQSASFFLQQASSSAILNNLNGHFRVGTLNALMGTSGAGKTSLLKVLNGQLKNRVSGSFYLNSTVPIETTFITQDISGHLLPGLTVRQSVLYASKLKNRDSIIGKDDKEDKIDHEAIVDNLLIKLGLEDTAGTRVERCSGGERKRIALALELASKVMPNLVFIDEPTSGLDSNSAEIVIACLRNLTRQHGITIIASIHQPNTEILRKFDQLYVLALGGHCIYSGPPTNIALTLNSLDNYPKPELNSSQTAEFPPIETLITLSCTSNPEALKSLIKLQNQTELEANSQLHTQTVLSSTGPAQPRSRFSLCACAILFHRYVHYFTGHQWKYTVFYYANYLGYALFLQLFFNFEMVRQDGCLDLVDGGALLSGNSRCSPSSSAASPIDSLFLLMDNLRYTHFFSVFYLTFIYLQAAFDTQRELQYFLNEHRNGWYSSGTFYLLKCLTEAGPILLLNLLYVYLINYYEFIRPGGLFWGLYLVLMVASIAIQGIAHILALLTHPNIPVLALLSITVTLFTVLLDDYLILTYRLHYVYAFLANFSIPRWTYEAIIMLQYGFGRCEPEKIQTLFYMMKIDDSDYTWNLGMLLGNLLLFRVIALWLLVKKANRGREESSKERGERLEKWNESMQPTDGIIPGISCSGGELPNIL